MVSAEKIIARTLLILGACCLGASATEQLEPINERPNPFSSVDGWADLPGDREWGSTAGVDIDPDGIHLWAIDRYGTGDIHRAHGERSME